MQETQGQSLDWEDPLEEETAIRSSILAWEVPWTKEPGRLQSMGPQKVDMTKGLTHIQISCSPSATHKSMQIMGKQASS